ncbi:flagellar basal body-associated protein FliL [Thalassotalea sp. G2M2-11]|uniref:flagellar basal body-associated protein FliL n=1 Tax=Thalassotalea sp. G2M2-11 TaxID=2787627 RepID=UPI0019D111C6|nr:flagellar basal body-associated protein FliL [Thalassotalea sp. G2M2-11]
MADEEKELELDNSGKKKKLIIIIAIVAVLVLGGGGAYFFFMGGEPEASQAQLDAALDTDDGSSVAPTSSDGKAKMGTALYVPMPRPFRFNVPGAARDRFVEIRVQLLVRGNENEESAKKHIPLIESTLLAVFSQSNADDLATSAGKTSLKQQALSEVHKIMMDVEDDKVVEQVLFTGFVMQ